MESQQELSYEEQQLQILLQQTYKNFQEKKRSTIREQQEKEYKICVENDLKKSLIFEELSLSELRDKRMEFYNKQS